MEPWHKSILCGTCRGRDSIACLGEGLQLIPLIQGHAYGMNQTDDSPALLNMVCFVSDIEPGDGPRRIAAVDEAVICDYVCIRSLFEYCRDVVSVNRL